MISVHCPRHQSRVLLGPRSLVASVDGTELRWRCHCGEQGVLRSHRTARARPPADALL